MEGVVHGGCMAGIRGGCSAGERQHNESANAPESAAGEPCDALCCFRWSCGDVSELKAALRTEASIASLAKSRYWEQIINKDGIGVFEITAAAAHMPMGPYSPGPIPSAL